MVAGVLVRLPHYVLHALQCVGVVGQQLEKVAWDLLDAEVVVDEVLELLVAHLDLAVFGHDEAGFGAIVHFHHLLFGL